MSEPGRVTAIVLAAGMARRFRSQKLLAPFGDRPLLQHVLDAVAEVPFAQVVVVLGSDADTLRLRMAWRDERQVLNPDPRRGLSSSLQIGLLAADPTLDGAVILLGDEPLVSVDVIRRVLLAADGTRPIVAPRYATAGGRFGHPVFLASKVWPRALSLDGDEGMGPLIRTRPDLVRTVEVLGDNPDVDVPSDLAVLQPPRRPAAPG